MKDLNEWTAKAAHYRQTRAARGRSVQNRPIAAEPSADFQRYGIGRLIGVSIGG